MQDQDRITRKNY